MQLDIRTAILFKVVFDLLFGLGLLIYNRERTAFRGVSMMGWGFVMTATGFFLIALRDVIGPLGSVIISNVAIVAGVMLVYRGLGAFYEHPIHSWVMDAAALTGMMALFIYYHYIVPDVNMRVVIISLYLVIYFMMAFFIIVIHPKYPIRSIQFFMGGVLALNAVYYLFRSIWTVFEPTMISFMAAGNIHSIAVIFFSVVPLVTCFGIFTVMNQVVHQQLVNMASYDTLTGLYNRRAFTQRVSNEPCLPEESPCVNSYVLCDVDDFKFINDNYGHDTGDAILQHVARLLSEHTREHDLVVRYGGDEFLIFFPRTEASAVYKVCEKLRLLAGSNPHVVNDIPVRITMSFGVYGADPADDSREQSITRADQALYEAKRQGRNMTVMYDAQSMGDGLVHGG